MIVVRGHLGFGDCIHQRAVLRELMKRDEVVLETFYSAMYHDLRERGLRLQSIHGHPARVRESKVLVNDSAPGKFNGGAIRHRMRYDATAVHRHGSILAAQFACCGLRMPERPDFSLPVPDAWRRAARERIGRADRPIMVYRPLVLNNLFHCEQRLPDVDVYAALYESVRDRYHVVSACNLGDYGERIVGPVMDADTELHRGELSGEELIGLYAEADLVFACAGFAPVLAQAVGTRCVVVYGGHEGFATTNSVGAHLAPTLAIEPVRVCECHGGHYTRGPNQELVKPVRDHECDKTTDLPAALERLRAFVEGYDADT